MSGGVWNFRQSSEKDSVGENEVTSMRQISAFDRFHMQHMPVPESGCWIWIGTINRFGYGRMKVNYKGWLAHRFSWEIHFGKIPDGLFVLHKCDIRCCVNPDHLFIGSQLENMRDMQAKGRGVQLIGERHGGAKLSDDEIQEIRESKHKRSFLSKIYGVDVGHIRNIQIGKTRKKKTPRPEK